MLCGGRLAVSADHTLAAVRIHSSSSLATPACQPLPIMQFLVRVLAPVAAV